MIIGWCTIPEKWCAMDGQTDKQKKWHTEVGAQPKNLDEGNIGCGIFVNLQKVFDTIENDRK